MVGIDRAHYVPRKDNLILAQHGSNLEYSHLWTLKRAFSLGQRVKCDNVVLRIKILMT